MTICKLAISRRADEPHLLRAQALLLLEAAKQNSAPGTCPHFLWLSRAPDPPPPSPKRGVIEANRVPFGCQILGGALTIMGPFWRSGLCHGHCEPSISQARMKHRFMRISAPHHQSEQTSAHVLPLALRSVHEPHSTCAAPIMHVQNWGEDSVLLFLGSLVSTPVSPNRPPKPH